MNFGQQIRCILSEEMSFETFTPIWSHVNGKKMAKIQNLKCHYSLNNFGRDPRWSMHDFLGLK